MNKLQVNVDGEWKYVFCLNNAPKVITTDDSRTALPGDAIGYFQRKMANLEFRVAK